MDANSFVFLDDRPWPYLAKQQVNGDWWLYYWSEGQKNFVTMRQLSSDDVERFRPLAMPESQANLYLDNARRPTLKPGMPLV